MRRTLIAVWVGLAGLILPAAPAAAAEPIEGRWSMGGGVVELRASGDGFTSRWITQRPDIRCPDIDDQNGDMRLRGSGRDYTGSWRWVLSRGDGGCESIGWGAVTVTVQEGGLTAMLEADAPSGYSERESHTLTRLPDAVPAGVDQLSARELGDAPELVDPLRLAPALGAVELASVPRLERLPFEGRTPFVR